MSSISPRSSSRRAHTRPSDRPRPRWGRRLVVAFLVLANVAVFFTYWQLRAVEASYRTSVNTVPDLGGVLTPSTPEPTDPVTFLVIGSDSRENLDDLSGFGDFEGQRADVIMLVRVEPAEDTARILSLPRDLYVDVPGEGKRKINGAYSLGGAQLMVDTVRRATGLEINHYVEVDFVGFQAIVDEVGGIRIDFPYPARDVKSGLDVEAGPQLLDGSRALAYARSRSYQELHDGKWVSVDADDIGRTRRQQQVIFAILSAMKKPSTLTDAAGIVESFARHLSVDEGLADASTLVPLAFGMRNLTPERIEAATLPTVNATKGRASVQLRADPEAGLVLDAFRRGESFATAVEEGPLTVDVLNGNGTDGSAGAWADILESRGFDVGRVGDADTSTFTETTVLVRPGQLAVGERIVDSLGFGSVTVGTIRSEVDAVVVVGSDHALPPTAKTAG